MLTDACHTLSETYKTLIFLYYGCKWHLLLLLILSCDEMQVAIDPFFHIVMYISEMHYWKRKVWMRFQPKTVDWMEVDDWRNPACHQAEVCSLIRDYKVKIYIYKMKCIMYESFIDRVNFLFMLTLTLLSLTFRCSAGVHKGGDEESTPGLSSQQGLNQPTVWVPRQASICSFSRQAYQWIQGLSKQSQPDTKHFHQQLG